MKKVLLWSLLGVLGLAATGSAESTIGQTGAPHEPLQTSEKQNLMGQLEVESLAARETRIQFWLNTPTYLAMQVLLESESFEMGRDANGGVLIESASPVRVTGFTLGHVSNVAVLQNAPGNVLTWDRGFALRILPDGTPQWNCCPRQ